MLTMYTGICFLVLFTASTRGRVSFEVDESDVITNNINEISDKTNAVEPGCNNASDPTSEITDNTIDNEGCEQTIKVDNGTALILTKYIEEGAIAEGRNASRVDPDLFLGMESYSGFLTVNKTYNSNLFFWYFPVHNQMVNETPWIIWLQGGPAASSLVGLFDEIGPFKLLSTGELMNRTHTWHRDHSIVYIDNPVGTGYSFTEHQDGLVADMHTYSLHLHKAVEQLVQLFPELRHAPLFVAGESYAGKYVPSLGLEIHLHNNETDKFINLQGLIIGNAYVDPSELTHLTNLYYNVGLIDYLQFQTLQPIVDRFAASVARNDSRDAKSTWTFLVVALLTLTGQSHAYNFLRDDVPVGGYERLISETRYKRALHVGDIRYSLMNITVNENLVPEFLASAKHKFEVLLDHYRVLAYCGQLDLMLTCAATTENYRTWRWSHSEEFLNATRVPFIVDHRLAGYWKSGGGLTEVVVRGAGHLVPIDAPRSAVDLVTAFTRARNPNTNRGATLHAAYLTTLIEAAAGRHNLNSTLA